MSGIIEILQEYCTTYRGGDWFDFLANTCGVIAATAFAWFVLRPWIVKDLNKLKLRCPFNGAYDGHLKVLTMPIVRMLE